MKAIVLCGGYGTRLGELTRDLPKPLLPLAGYPLLAYTLAHLARCGFREVAINLHFRPEQIRQALGDGSRFGVDLHYSHEEELLGTAGTPKKLEPWLGESEDFLVLYGDLLTDQDLGALWQAHRRRRPLATLVLHQRFGSNSLVRLADDGRITAFIERPTPQQRRAAPFPWVNSGIQILNRRLLEYVESGKAVDLPRDVYTRVVDREVLHGMPLPGYRCAIDSPERYAAAQEAVTHGPYRSPLPRSPEDPGP